MADSSNPIFPNSKPKFPDWQNEFEAVLLEGEPNKLPERVQAAEAAIFLRWQVLF